MNDLLPLIDNAGSFVSEPHRLSVAWNKHLGRGKAHARGSSRFRACALPEQSRAMPTFSIRKEQVMNWDRVEGNWRQLKGKVKEQWGKLTDDQIDQVAGKRDQLVGLVQEKYGIERDKAERDVDSWVSKLN
jgi:uncharacterized protein YjbJ (UPF0337 family)